MSKNELIAAADRDEAEVTELMADAQALDESAKKQVRRGLLRSSRGSGTIEKIFMIALFIIVAAAGLMKLGATTKKTLEKQAKTIKSAGVN